MAIGTIASIASIAVAAASLANMGYQASQGAPKIPSGASASREIAQAQAAALPTQRALAAAEQQGTTAQYQTAAHKDKVQTAFVPNPSTTVTIAGKTYQMPGKGGSWVPYDSREWEPGGKYNPNGAVAVSPRLKTQNINIAPETKTADFTGYGTADIEGELARKYADIQQELGAKYGEEYAKEAAHEAELADPQGTAARKMEYEMIQKHLANPEQINPLSSVLENQIDAQVKAGSGLDPMSRDLLDQAVAQANASRGNNVNPNDVATSLSTGAEGEQRRQAGLTKAQGFLSSGSSPADIEYRREQQNLADLSSFTQGRTPESQFQQLSGAGQGAAPFIAGQPGPTMPNNAGPAGNAYSAAAYNANTRSATQPSPWISGLSAILSGVSALGKATG